jgi:flagellar motor switch protein FliG
MSIPENLKKAAILVASLDTEAADRLLEQMGEEQARLVRRAIMDLDPVDPSEERAVLEEFKRLGIDPTRRTPATKETERSVPSAKKNLRIDPPQPDVIPFHFLHHARGEKITPLLVGEHPQTIALVVSHLPPEQAVEVLAELSADMQADVLNRVAHLDDAHPEVVREVERGLHRRASEFIREEQRRISGTATLKKILDAAPGKIRRELLANLSHGDRTLARELTPVVPHVSFDDLAMLGDVAWRVLLGTAERELIVLALTDAAPDMVERVVNLLPSVDRAAVRHALQHPGPTRLSDVSEAQRELGRIAGQLAADGLIDLPYRRHAMAA